MVRTFPSFLVAHEDVRVEWDQGVVPSCVPIRSNVFPIQVIFDFKLRAYFLRVEDRWSIQVRSWRVAGVRAFYVLRQSKGRPSVHGKGYVSFLERSYTRAGEKYRGRPAWGVPFSRIFHLLLFVIGLSTTGVAVDMWRAVCVVPG